MSFPITGAEPSDTGPAGCVVRFMIASAAGEVDAMLAEMHPDSRAGVSSPPKSPPDIAQVEILELQEGEGQTLVPTKMSGVDGTEQRFTFAVRPYDAGLGIDLEASFAATFGGNPVDMIGEAMTAAVAPLGEALDQLGAGMTEAFGGGGSHQSSIPARRISADSELPTTTVNIPDHLEGYILALEVRHSLQRSQLDDPLESQREIAVRCRFVVPPTLAITACTGVTLTSATALTGEDLIPANCDENFAAENYSSWERDEGNYYVRMTLAPPPATFTGLATLNGRARFAAQGGELLEVILGPVVDLCGSTVTIAALGLNIDIARDGDGYLNLRVPAGGFERLVELDPVDAAGESISQSWSGSGDGEFDTRMYSSEIPDDGALLLRFWTFGDSVEIPFTIRELPLLME